MAITIYNDDPNTVVTVIDGNPPVDQSVLVAELQAQVASLTAANASLTAQVTHLQSEIQQAKDNAALLVQGLND